MLCGEARSLMLKLVCDVRSEEYDVRCVEFDVEALCLYQNNERQKKNTT